MAQVYPLKEDLPPSGECLLVLGLQPLQRPTCLEVCPVVAYYKRDKDGVVVHEQEKCIGCGNCIRSCPYGAARYNPILKKAEKCSFCWQRLDAGLKPACVLGCPTKVELIDVVSFQDPDTVQYIAGFPASRGSTRPLFRPPRQPLEIRR